MIRTLLIIAGAAFVLALGSAAGALAIGGRDMAAHGWNWTFRDSDGDGDTLSIVRDDGTRPIDTTRRLEWSGGEQLVIDLSADVDYVQGDTPGVVITGPADQVNRIRLDGDRLTADQVAGPRHERIVFGRHRDGRGIWVRDDDVKIVVTAPSVRRFVMNGSSDLYIRGFDQPELSLDMTGSGDVMAEGRATSLVLVATGSGDADLESLSVSDARVSLSGSGDARIAPTQAADLTTSGSGDIDLATRPTTLRQSSTGSGSVRQD